MTIRSRQLRQTALIDFEASSLVNAGLRSYPIEVAIGFPDTGEVRAWLIRPKREWIDTWTWDPAAQRLHGLSLNDLYVHGRPRTEVAREMMAMIGDRTPLSDNPEFDQYWLWVLNGGRYPGVRVGSLGRLLEAIAGNGQNGRSMLETAHAKARMHAPRTHRAGDDVRHLLAVLRTLLQLSEG